MKVRYKTEGYRVYNEDGIIIHKNYYIVLDGATTLYDNQKGKNSSIASELVDYTIKELPKLLDKHSFIEAIHVLSKKSYEHFNFKTNEPVRLPTMVIAAAEVNSDYVTFYSLGDLGISYLNTNNKLYRIIDTSVGKLDEIAINVLEKTNDNEALLKILRKHRNLLGIKYQAFIPSLEPNFIFITRRSKTKNLKKILIYSDGYYSLRSPFKAVRNHQDFFNFDIIEAFSVIKNRAYSDPTLKQYKRVKLIDDISVIELIMSNN